MKDKPARIMIAILFGIIIVLSIRLHMVRNDLLMTKAIVQIEHGYDHDWHKIVIDWSKYE
jgi:hypothetical protein